MIGIPGTLPSEAVEQMDQLKLVMWSFFFETGRLAQAFFNQFHQI